MVISVKNHKIFPPLYFAPPLMGFPLEFDAQSQKTRMMGKFFPPPCI